MPKIPYLILWYYSTVGLFFFSWRSGIINLIHFILGLYIHVHICLCGWGDSLGSCPRSVCLCRGWVSKLKESAVATKEIVSLQIHCLTCRFPLHHQDTSLCMHYLSDKCTLKRFQYGFDVTGINVGFDGKHFVPVKLRKHISEG